MRPISDPYNHLYLRRLQRFLLIRWLYLFNFLTGRRLNLTFITEPGPFNFAGSHFTLSWQLRGCHQIIVNDSVFLPGTTAFIRLDPAKLQGSVLLSFHGCQQVITKTYAVRTTDLQMKRLTHTALPEPELKVRRSGWPEKLLLSERIFCVPVSTVTLPSLRLLIKSPLNIRTAQLQVQLPACDLPQQDF